MKARAISLALSTTTAFVLSGPLAAIAWAEPAGCTHNTTNFSKSSSGLMSAVAVGDCSTAKSRTLRVEIKQDKSFQPDPLVAANSTSGTKTSYYVVVQSCDNHNTATYYGRSFFTNSPTYDDTAHYKWTVC